MTKKDYLDSPRICSEYIYNSDPNAFYRIMSNKTILCFDHKFGHIDYEPEELLRAFVRDIHTATFTDLINNIDTPALQRSEIPLINSINDIDPLLHHMSLGSDLTFVLAGNYLCDYYANDAAKAKAGEIHLKLLSIMGLGNLFLITPRQCHINCLGKYYISLDTEEREKLLQKLMMKIPIVSTLFQKARYEPTSISQVIADAQITGTTIDRRSSSVRALIDYVGQDKSLHKLHSNICK